MEPFGQALGMDSEEFRPWRQLFETDTDAILLVEGETDREYFELLRDPAHGTNRLLFDGEIIPYDGVGNLKNTVLLRFIRNRYKRVYVTFDLDLEQDAERALKALGMEKNKHYCAVGRPEPGKRNIEGLVPDSVRTAVYAANPALVQAAVSGTADEQRSAKSNLKALLLQAFKKECCAGASYQEFYKLVPLANSALNNDS
jgi:hypothetical protein